jgi:hypothetical protein
MSEWLPIETAPKDGTCVLVVSCGRVVTASFSKYSEKWFDGCLNDLDGTEQPTHWMPLPAPPEAK